MKRIILVEKRSKRARKEYYAGKRRTWGDFNPVTRTIPSGKIYNRKQAKREISGAGN